jgi:hypothetical protein
VLDSFARINSLHYLDRLAQPLDDRTGIAIHQLLVEEETKLTHGLARLDEFDHFLSLNGERIERQKRLLANGLDQSDKESAARILKTLQKTQALLEDFRRQLSVRLESNRL